MRIIRHTTGKSLSFFVVISLLIVSSGAVMAEDRSAPLPTWTKGQTWAVGGERDLKGVLQENLGTLQDALALLGGNVSVDRLLLNGNAGAWTVFKVSDVQQDKYILEYSAGVRIQGDVDLGVSGDLPAEGQYLLADMTDQAKSVTVLACLDLCLTSHGFLTVDKATMAIEGATSSTLLDEHLTFEASNFPNYSTSINMNGITVNMSYADYAVDECMHLELASCVDFDPSLQILKFPLTVSDNWTFDSKMTFTGTAKGYFNATGLPSSMTSAFDTKNGPFTGSVRIQDLTRLGSLSLSDGNITSADQNLIANMECTRTKLMDDGAGNSMNVFEVLEKKTGAHIYYSPEKEFLVGALVKPQMDMLNGMVALPESSMTSALDLNTDITMVTADPTNATSEIIQIGANQGVEPISLVVSDSTGANTAPASSPATIGLFEIAIVIIAALVCGVLLFRILKKKG
ncbi:MAG TPA: hypothetical protein VGK23_00815 [Methanomassiliicoccales archaeon]